MTFHLHESQFARTAVVNLLKATIDGLANRVFAPGGPGRPGPWTRADHWITTLTAEKRLSSHVGARVILEPATSWMDTDAWTSGTWAYVSGPPAVWVSEREKVWRDHVTHSLSQQIDTPLESPIETRMSFRIAAHRFDQLDLDNLAYPAVQAIALAAFHAPRNALQIHRITAEKARVDSRDEQGLLVGVRRL